MSPARRCRVPLPAPPTPLVLTLDDALDVLVNATGPGPGVACLLLDGEQRLLTCLEVAGAADAAAVLDVAEVLVSLAAQETALASVVLGCHRPGGSYQPDDAETCCYLELQDTFADAGLELLDWLLVSERGISSLAERTGSGGW